MNHINMMDLLEQIEENTRKLKEMVRQSEQTREEITSNPLGTFDADTKPVTTED